MLNLCLRFLWNIVSDSTHLPSCLNWLFQNLTICRINFEGLLLPTRELTEDGYEMHFGTNHLGHFLLTELVKPLIMKSSASGFHPRYRIDLKGVLLPTQELGCQPTGDNVMDIPEA